MKKVMCFGTFDKLHPGHLFYLEESKKVGDYLIVVVARDENVLKIKNKLPSENELIRLEKLRQLELVDEVILGNFHDRLAVVRENNPDILCFGYDQQVDEKSLQEFFSGQMIRQKSFRPEIYKSSKISNEK